MRLNVWNGVILFYLAIWGVILSSKIVIHASPVQIMNPNPIEQAILYVKDHRNVGSAGIVAKTCGVQQTDEEELLGWAFDYEGDFHCQDCLEEANPTGIEPHLYFHPLPSGCYVLARQTRFHDAKSDSFSLVSHCLVIRPQLLRAFHNNVLAIHQALIGRSDFHFLSSVQPNDMSSLVISPIDVGVRYTPIIDVNLLETVHSFPDTACFASLLSSSVHSICTVVMWLLPSIPLINGIIQCLPIALRPELTFASSLHFSASRPLRLIAAHENSRTCCDICRRFAIPFFQIVHLDVNMLRQRLAGRHDWASFVYHLFDSGAYDQFIRSMTGKLKTCSFETQRGTPDWNMLNTIGRTLLDLWNRNGNSVADDCWDEILLKNDETNSERQEIETKPKDIRLVRGDFSHDYFRSEDRFNSEPIPNSETKHDSRVREAELQEILMNRERQRANYNKTNNERQSTDKSQRRLSRRFPQYEQEIRRLDSLIARSLFGDAIALDALEEAWRALRKCMTFDEIEVIRETYIHLVQSVIVQPRDPDYPKPPRRSLDSLEVMNIFLQE